MVRIYQNTSDNSRLRGGCFEHDRVVLEPNEWGAPCPAHLLLNCLSPPSSSCQKRKGCFRALPFTEKPH